MVADTGQRLSDRLGHQGDRQQVGRKAVGFGAPLRGYPTLARGLKGSLGRGAWPGPRVVPAQLRLGATPSSGAMPAWGMPALNGSAAWTCVWHPWRRGPDGGDLSRTVISRFLSRALPLPAEGLREPRRREGDITNDAGLSNAQHTPNGKSACSTSARFPSVLVEVAAADRACSQCDLCPRRDHGHRGGRSPTGPGRHANVVGGLRRPDRRHVRIAGRDVAGFGPAGALGSGSPCLPAPRGCFSHLNSEDNIPSGASRAGRRSGWSPRALERAAQGTRLVGNHAARPCGVGGAPRAPR